MVFKTEAGLLSSSIRYYLQQFLPAILQDVSFVRKIQTANYWCLHSKPVYLSDGHDTPVMTVQNVTN